MNWKRRIEQAIRPHHLDAEILEELAQHASAMYAAARAEGDEADDADARVARQIEAWAADPTLLARRPKRLPAVTPPAGSTGAWAAVRQDARYALRLFARQPAYSALVIATMALGIAATTIIGSVAYGVLLKPLPWADAPRLVRLYESREGSTRRFGPLMTNLSYLAWRDHATTLDAMGAWTGARATVTDGGEATRVRTQAVTPSLFPMLGVVPFAGRPFAEDDALPGHQPVAILSYGLWQQRFGGRAEAIGQSITLDGTPHTIVGVMPASFAFPDRETRLWTPFAIKPVTTPGQQGANISLFNAVGRLRPGVTPEQAAAEGTARGRSIPVDGMIKVVSIAVFGSDGPTEVTTVPLLADLVASVRPAILILFAAVLLLLATAAANVASLQLARATGRRRELSIRAALGAGSGRLARQTLVENLLLGALGGAAGLLLAAVMQRALPSLLPRDFPRVDDITLNLRVALFGLTAAIVSGLVVGLLPALQASRRDLVSALTDNSLAPVGGALRSPTARARAAIMAGQVGIATVLLVGAVLLVRSFVGLMHANTGYDTNGVLLAQVTLPDLRYTPERRVQVLGQFVDRLRAQPGVTAVSYGGAIPFGNSTSLSSFPLKKADGTTVQVQTGARMVGPGYFSALGQRVVQGREFTARDTATGQEVVMVNREFERKYLDGHAMGATLPGTKTDRPIIGVVDDAVRRSITDAPAPEIYWAGLQRPPKDDDVSLIVRTSGDPSALAPVVRSAIHEQDAQAPVDQITTLQDLVSQSVATPRLYMTVLATFAAFALIIAAVGLFGVLSYTVAQRAREIGVRSALGAQVRDIVALVVRQSMGIALAGLAAGLIAAFWMTSTLRAFLYGVTPHDLVSFAVVAAVLLLVALVASIVPARRAARVDPVRVLRG